MHSHTPKTNKHSHSYIPILRVPSSFHSNRWLVMSQRYQQQQQQQQQRINHNCVLFLCVTLSLRILVGGLCAAALPKMIGSMLPKTKSQTNTTSKTTTFVAALQCSDQHHRLRSKQFGARSYSSNYQPR